MDMRQALERLCACTAPSGFEAPAAAVAAELLRPLVDEVSVDRMGNVLGVRRCGKEGAPRLLLDAHLDEIGLLVTGVEDGFLRFRSIGGVDPRMLPGRELVVLTDPPRRGIVTCPAGGEADKSIPLSELFVDVGLSQTEAERAVPVGTPMVYRGGCFALGEDQMCGKSMDDRSCFVTLLRAAELLRDRELDVDLYLLGSTREEVSGAGATVGTWAVQPDFCVAVDLLCCCTGWVFCCGWAGLPCWPCWGWGRLPPLLLLFLGWFWALFAFGWFCAGAGAALGSGFFWGADSA